MAAALQDRDRKLKALDAALAKPVDMPDRDVLRAALELRGVEWCKVLRGPHIKQARLVLQHLMALPMVITNAKVPKYIKKGDTRGVKWSGTRPGGLLVGLVQSMASPTGFEPAEGKTGGTVMFSTLWLLGTSVLRIVAVVSAWRQT